MDLIDALREFTIQGTQCSLQDFQHLTGHLNWALNVYPLLCPGLSALYAKMAGKLEKKALIWVNNDVTWELMWVTNHLLACISFGPSHGISITCLRLLSLFIWTLQEMV
ncbi:hypothetical protein DFH29DRAFT_805771 [Suillus ampliporus]|nr:hypothetical protein DFH29DRAFT_805771 [Suillus ampliporus]